jgi:hypothetical protein
VYLGAIVVLVTAMRQGPTPKGARRLHALFGADRRTISRWQEFWLETFPRTTFWASGRARFMPPVNEKHLPQALLEAVEGYKIEEKLRSILRFLSPITTPGGLVLSDFEWT